MEKPILYFLCTGNSCRSQIAEGFGKKHLGKAWDIRSAGIEAHGVNSLAIRAMDEVGVDISDQASSLIDHDTLNQATLVITLCGDAQDNCPNVPSHIKKDHWGFDDPAKAEGTEAEKWQVFQRVRKQIEERIIAFKQTGE